MIVASGNPRALHTVADLAQPGLHYVNRQPGSGTRLLAEHLLAEAGVDADAIDGFHGPCEETHVAVAAAVASGAADAGLGIEAAAAQFSAGFVPLVEEDYYLLCRKEALDSAAVVRLRELLAGPDWGAALAALPGCTPHDAAGSVLALTKALPWWHYRSPRRSST